jgi:tRNA(Ile)-lysidine synthase
MDDSLASHVARRLRGRRVVLAVSGGLDSMSLLHAAVAGARESIACVASFDHATGAHGARACELVRRVAHDLRVDVVTERAMSPGSTEAEWRAQRWGFLRRVARAYRAQVATAHTRDDQIETVLMRTMRGAGARGLAGLAVEDERAVLRPLLPVSRSDVHSYAASAKLRWVEDPTNARTDHLRNRIRHDLLPALARARPSLHEELVDLGARAARLRAEVEDYVDRELEMTRRDGGLLVAREVLLRYDVKELALLWPALAARAGATLDRRGTERLVAFTTEGRRGARVQLSGGFETVSHRDAFIIRKATANAAGSALGLSAGVRVGDFRFHARDEAVVSLWSAALPAHSTLTVRMWRAGDRMTPSGGSARRVKGLLRDAGVDAASRHAWPVVLADDEIVWIPGVRRSGAASARSDRPAVTFHCERINR